jgi:protein phosphatase
MELDIWGAGLTDVGHKRKQNEDSFLCDVASRLFVVADGMGGRTLGETASKVVVTLLPLMVKEGLAALDVYSHDAIVALLEDTLCRLSHELYLQSQKMPSLKGLGSTVTTLFIQDDMAYIAYAGDSRIYLLRGADLIQVTEDQTTAAALVKLGELSPEVAEHHPLRHALEEYIGKEGTLNPGVHYEKLCVGDRWLLCSDGLTKGLLEKDLRELLLHHPTPEDACRILIEKAKEADGTDNITAIVVDITRAQTHCYEE